MSESEAVQYVLTDPMIITSRLMPGVTIGDGTIHIAADSIAGHRVQWRYVIDTPQGTYEATDFTTARNRDTWGEEVRHALGGLCGFLSYYADPNECGEHEERMQQFGDVSAWLIANREDISAMEDELQEN